MAQQVSDLTQQPMFAFRSLNRADMATDLAIPLMAEGGWPAVTLAGVAQRGNMRRQSVLQWFGTAEALREQVAWRYARRWVLLLSGQLSVLYRRPDPDPATVARLLLPEDDDGIVFARIWLTICEAGRNEMSIAAATAFGEGEQHAMVERWLPEQEPGAIRALGAIVTGLRSELCSRESFTLADAHACVDTLRR